MQPISVLFCKQSSEYEEAKALKNRKYMDRAESRRQTVGSEGVFKRDDAPASVHEWVFFSFDFCISVFIRSLMSFHKDKKTIQSKHKEEQWNAEEG